MEVHQAMVILKGKSITSLIMAKSFKLVRKYGIIAFGMEGLYSLHIQWLLSYSLFWELSGRIRESNRKNMKFIPILKLSVIILITSCTS